MRIPSMKLPRVLLVDDDALIVKTVQRILVRTQIAEVAVAKDGSDALKMLRAHPFDGVICDLDMPIVPGAVVLATVKTEFPELLNRFALHTSSVELARDLHPIVLSKCDRREIVEFSQKLVLV